ncbi:MAG: preprotein translocase subunit YajC [Armatimonadetes bacterium CG_4_10_14_3_um_filter_66_18]|nr:preprotein translocase subunit YajC [Armatimonadota bacterium]PIU94768.1 MAG: preprotein translocase subunit YajC [Armatimonadetes bacterium CG06_land_8_20_14_3_00_66_21]PIX38656.1 MAG: preprotein translocase subunit YajC [Armatimonadetes bacterium CG_4_8_14_3_um_filter_66_20]PIY46059.1 MAG: preprotein translocase subunit YajC [Armatimonadetes bacterium CG_4_10_14_3_um_filter_66_18]PIZ48382.1 MAG: preprotein translocase subunit YajC [Armatimonadetes bacterium CG_4_10_14_0_8_um_filter_66_14]
MPELILAIPPQLLKGPGLLIAFYVFILGFFYLFLIRPQAKKAKEHKDFAASLDKGDRIVTAGGIHGTILRTKAAIVYVDVGKGIILRFDRTAIRRRQGEDEE